MAALVAALRLSASRPCSDMLWHARTIHRHPQWAPYVAGTAVAVGSCAIRLFTVGVSVTGGLETGDRLGMDGTGFSTEGGVEFEPPPPPHPAKLKANPTVNPTLI